MRMYTQEHVQLNYSIQNQSYMMILSIMKLREDTRIRSISNMDITQVF